MRRLRLCNLVHRRNYQVAKVEPINYFASFTMDVTEVDEDFEMAVGITEFANKATGLRGILKQRYSDFIVREIALNGSVSYLTDTSGKELEEKVFGSLDKEVLDNTKDSSSQEKAQQIIDDVLAIGSQVSVDLDLEGLKKFLEMCYDKSPECTESFTAFPDLDKISRTNVHKIFKSKMSEYVDTITAQVDGRSLIRINANHKRPSGNNNKRKRSEWPSSVGNFLKFTLLKENIDTMNAVTILNNNLRCFNNSGVTYSGTKDKRGVTIQKCTVFRRKPSDFIRLNNSKMLPTILCGDFEYVNEEATLGDGGGNRFEIVLRALNTNKEDVIIKTCEEMQNSGFINYFGLQRFGKGGTRSHEFGKAILKSDWESCVRMLFTPRDGDRQNIAQAKELFFANDITGALRVIPEVMYAEKCVLQRLVQKPGDFMSAYAAIPKNARLICAHAYQSYLWNKATSRRMQLYGRIVTVGDLVLNETQSSSEGVQSNAPEQNAKAGDASAAAVVKHVTAEDIACERYTIYDIVLPIPGYESVYPANEIGAYYDELLASDGLTRSSYQTCHVTYREKGVYRKMLQSTKDFEWKAISYDDPDAELAETELAQFRETRVPRAATSEEKIPDTAVVASTTEGTDTATTTATVATTTVIPTTSPRFWALQVKFSLPPGTYATMLLRELTKSSTESQFQAQLTKDSAISAPEL